MKNLLTKKSVLATSALIFGVAIILDQIGIERSCPTLFCLATLDVYFSISFVVIPTFIFSLITYKMREEVFRAWWNFARWFAPVIIVVTVLQSMQGGGGGLGIGGAISGGFDRLVLGIFYAMFIGVSLWKIFRKYSELKHEDK